jgi:copper resistance protein C
MLKKIAGLVLVLMLMVPLVVSAHAELVSSNPQNGSTIKGPISSVKMIFGEEVKHFNSMTIKDSKGNSYSVSKYDLNGKNVTVHLSKPLTDGQYTFEWKVLSQDGHIAPGDLQFTVGNKNQSPAKQTANSDVQQKKTTSSPVVPIVIVVLIVVVLIGAFTALKKKK